MEYLIYAGIVVLVGFFILRTDARPRGCTCKTYNSIYQGPVDKCPVHKHYIED